jgi:hypothetical protein
VNPLGRVQHSGTRPHLLERSQPEVHVFVENLPAVQVIALINFGLSQRRELIPSALKVFNTTANGSAEFEISMPPEVTRRSWPPR